MEFRTKLLAVTKRESTRRYARWVLEDQSLFGAQTIY
jgi:hypothetical protein